VPLHPTTSSALGRYPEIRQRGSTKSDYIFISPKGTRLPYSTVGHTFRRLVRQTGIRSVPQKPAPCIHSLRHTFAVRVLETSLEEGSAVGWRVRALSTYLGHVHTADTYWYLEAIPELMQLAAERLAQTQPEVTP